MNRKIALLVLALIPLSCAAQVQGGTPPLASLGGGPLDIINLSNLNNNINIPVTTRAGRGASFYYILSYNSSIWYPASVNGVMTWQPISNYGWQANTNASAFGYLSHQTVHGRCGTTGFYFGTLNWVYHDLNGATHALVGADSGTDCDGGSYSDPGGTTDGTGLTLNLGVASSNGKLTRSDGRVINLGDSTIPSSVDTNGNQITTDGTNYVDTLGANALTVSGTPPSPVTYTFPNSSGGNSTVTAHYGTFTIQTNFGCSGTAEYSAASINLMTSIVLPDSSQYSFTYEQTPGYGAAYTTGRIASITLPTGSTISYTYTGGNNGIICADGSTAGFNRTVSGNVDHAFTFRYDRPSIALPYTGTEVWDPAGNHEYIQFQGIYETQRDTYIGTQGTPWKTVYTCYNGAAYPCASTGVSLPITEIKATTLLNSLYRQTDTTYTTTGLPLITKDYDWGSGAIGALLRETDVTYTTILNIQDRPTDILVKDGSGNRVAETQLGYDQSTLTGTSGAPHHDYTNFSTSFTTRGNPTTISKWVSGTTFLSTTNTYDDLGNLRSTTDAGNHTTNLDYTDNYNDGVNHGTLAFATTITMPTTGSPAVSHIVKSKFYWPSAMLYQSTDQNNQVTTYTYDSSWRPLTVSYPDGGQTTYNYPNTQQVQVQRKIDASNSTNQWSEVDGFGRPSRSAVANGETNPFDQVDTCYDPANTNITTSYAYQGSGIASGPNGTKHCSSSQGDVLAYDQLGRPVSLTHSDLSSVSTSYTGRAVKVQDEGTGTTRITHVYQQDGIGRTLSVCEEASSIFGITTMGTCGLDIDGSVNGVTTSYSYDPLGNVTAVSQGALIQRQLTYDGLGRLVSEVIPEAGGTTTSFAYDSQGNLQSRTRPSPNQTSGYQTTTTYSYDELHRLTGISYSDTNPSPPYQTPGTAFFYDQTSVAGLSPHNPIGRLTNAYTPVGSSCTSNYLSYDAMGRTDNEWQSDPSLCGHGSWLLTYTYNLDGSLHSATNSQGVTTTYSYNIGERATQIASSPSDANHPGMLFSAAHYNAGGELLSDLLGNGVNETFTYDARWRMLSASAMKGTNTVYGLGGPGTGNTVTYAANSSLTAASDSVNGTWAYTYDALNRIAGANKSGGTNFTFDIDRNANRWHQNPVGQGAQLTFDNTTNHVSGSGVTYDAAGNIRTDGLGCTYTYDAEGNIVRVTGCTTASYDYDVFNRRVRKTVNGTVDELIYDLQGNVITDVQNGIWARGEVFAGGARLATYWGGTTYFEFADWLGSDRVRSDVNGNIAGTCTGNPYGDSYTCTGTDPSPLKYAGMEYDSETQLYHTRFRYYNPRLGLWMTPDPAGMSAASSGNPQSMNRYAYALNSPSNARDWYGLDVIPCNSGKSLTYGCSPMPGRGSGAYLDGGYIPGDLVGLLIPDGSAAICPDGACSQTVWVGGLQGEHWQYQTFRAFASGASGYFALGNGPGGLFYSISAAVKAAGGYLRDYLSGDPSDDHEYHTNFYGSGGDVFSYSEFQQGPHCPNGCEWYPDFNYGIPADASAVGYLHNHPGTSEFSVEDLITSRSLDRNAFLLTGGAILWFNPSLYVPFMSGRPGAPSPICVLEGNYPGRRCQ